MASRFFCWQEEKLDNPYTNAYQYANYMLGKVKTFLSAHPKLTLLSDSGTDDSSAERIIIFSVENCDCRLRLRSYNNTATPFYVGLVDSTDTLIREGLFYAHRTTSADANGITYAGIISLDNYIDFLSYQYQNNYYSEKYLMTIFFDLDDTTGARTFFRTDSNSNYFYNNAGTLFSYALFERINEYVGLYDLYGRRIMHKVKFLYRPNSGSQWEYHSGMQPELWQNNLGGFSNNLITIDGETFRVCGLNNMIKPTVT